MLRRVEGQTHLEKDVLQAHDAKAHRPPAIVRLQRLLHRVEVDIDDAIEHGYGNANGVRQLLEVEYGLAVLIHLHVAAKVHGAQVADSCLVLAGDLGDLRAQVREVDDIARLAGLIVLGVAGVLERHPAVAGLGQRTHHAGVQITRLDLAIIDLVFLSLDVGLLELLAEQVGELGHKLGVEERPHAVLIHALHEQVRNPVGGVEVVSAAGDVAGVLTQFEEAFDVRVPRLQVDAACALTLAALVDSGDGGIQRAQPRDDAVRQTIRRADQRSLATHTVKRKADAAGELAEQRNVLIGVVDALERVLRAVMQVAARHLRMLRAAVEERRR